METLLALCRFQLSSGSQVINCAVSGGADSLALLVLASAYAKPRGLDVVAHHVDHQLRDNSHEDAAVVESACGQLGARFVGYRVDVGIGPNLEARARNARMEVLPDDTLFGHTADDQAETMLINLLRGAGIDGMAGIGPERHPILKLRRQQTHRLCELMGFQPVCDPTNNSSKHQRNRVRGELLSLMNDIGGRDVVEVLSRQADIFRDAVELLNQLAGDLDPTDAKALQNAHHLLATRAVRAWLKGNLDPEQHPPDGKALQRVMSVVYGKATSCDVVGGYRVLRSQQRLRLEKN